MLRELLLRDWRLNQRAILINVALFTAFQVYFVIRVDSTRAWFVFTSFYAAFLILTVFAREDKFRCASWTCSLPVTRREIVGARFAGAWLQVAGALAVAVILAVVVPGSRIDLAGIVQPETLLLAATVAAVVVALMLPFTIRFGLIGVMIFLVAAQVLGAGALFLAIALASTSPIEVVDPVEHMPPGFVEVTDRWPKLDRLRARIGARSLIPLDDIIAQTAGSMSLAPTGT